MIPHIRLVHATTGDPSILAIVAAAVEMYLDEERAARPDRPEARWVAAARLEACGITPSPSALAYRRRRVR